MEAKAVAKYVRVSPRRLASSSTKSAARTLSAPAKSCASRSALSPRPLRRFSTRPWQMPRTTMACPPTTWS